MNKLTAVVSALTLSALSFSTNAANLGEAKMIEPSGKYTSSVYYITLQWDEDVEMVNPQTDESGKKYFNATINAGGYESVATFNYKTTYDYSTWEEVEVKNQVTASVYSNLTNPNTYETLWGEVKISLPAGVVKNGDGSQNQAQEFNFVLMPSTYDYTLTPKDYSTVNPKSLKETKITFDGVVTLLEGTSAITTAIDGNENLLSEDKITVDDNSLILDLSDLPIGYNNITIPEGYVMVTDSEGKQSINNQIMFSYTVWDGMSKGDVLHPQGFSVASLTDPIKITWGGPITLNENILPKIYSYTSALNEDVPADAVTISENILYIDLSSYANKISSGSSVELNIPEGLVTGEDGMNPAQTFNFYYYAPYGHEAEFEMDNNTVLITWPEITSISSSYDKQLYLINPDGSTTELTWSQYGSAGDVKIPGYDEPFEGERIEVYLSGLELASGEYTLVIPINTVLFYMPDYSIYCNPKGEYKFIIDNGDSNGIFDINAESNDILRIYNIQGVNILNTTDRNAINTLSNGIYIINGKKVMIRK